MRAKTGSAIGLAAFCLLLGHCSVGEELSFSLNDQINSDTPTFEATTRKSELDPTELKEERIAPKMGPKVDEVSYGIDTVKNNEDIWSPKAPLVSETMKRKKTKFKSMKPIKARSRDEEFALKFAPLLAKLIRSDTNSKKMVPKLTTTYHGASTKKPSALVNEMEASEETVTLASAKQSLSSLDPFKEGLINSVAPASDHFQANSTVRNQTPNVILSNLELLAAIRNLLNFITNIYFPYSGSRHERPSILTSELLSLQQALPAGIKVDRQTSSSASSNVSSPTVLADSISTNGSFNQAIEQKGAENKTLPLR